MKLVFKKIQIHNFKSFGDETVDFGSVNGLVQVNGVNLDIPNTYNGSGKTSLFTSILYCLFGEIDQKIKNKNLKNRYAASKDLSVGILLDVDDHHYKIVRGLTKNNGTYLNVYDVSNDVEKDITKSSINETQEFIEKEILHCDISIFLRTIFLTSDQNYNFFRLSAAAKRDFIEKLFNISVFGEMFNLIHKDSLTFAKNISALQNQLLVLTKNNEEYEKRLKSFDSEKQQKILLKESEIEGIKGDLAKLNEEIAKMNDSETATYREGLNKLNDAKSKINESISSIDVELSQLVDSIYKLNAKTASNKKLIEKYSGLIDCVCNDCKKKVMKYYSLDNAIAENKSMLIEAKEKEECKANKENEKSELNKKIEKINDKIDEVNRKIQDVLMKSTKIKSEADMKERLRAKCENEIEEIKNSKNPYDELYASNKKELDEKTEKLKDLDGKAKYLKFAEQIVSQDTLKKFIIKDLVLILNNRIKTYLSKLGTNYNCIFDENMDYHFIPYDSEECEYGNFSAGERMRLIIATSLAFRDFLATRNNLTSNILILDEFIDSNLDGTSVEEILKILQSFTRMYSQKIFVISHRKEVDASIFDSLLLIKKENNISHVEIQKNEK